MIIRPGNTALKKCILDICHHVATNFYGTHCLDPTGPYLLGKYVNEDQCNTINGYDKILMKDKIILQMYESYREYQRVTSKHYAGFWDERSMYRKILLSDYDSSSVLATSLPEIDTTIIPKIVFQTWKLPVLQKKMKETFEYNKQVFPEYEFRLFSDTMCENVIDTYFTKAVKDAYNALLPGAFKADLWRYCILYVYGGIYMDIKFKILPTCNLDAMITSEYFVQDRSDHFLNGNGIYNAFIIVKPRNEYLLEAIQRIVINVRNKHYGYCPLYPTGPGLLGEIIPLDYDYKLRHDDINGLNTVIMGDVNILQCYNTYRAEQKNITAKSYDQLWHERAIYV
jgi:mannosyltransferase OCH1-like enzyme